MSSEIAVKVADLSKCYLIYDHPKDRLKQYFVPRLNNFVGLEPRKFYREFWALQNVSFEVPKGQTVGVIGRNGSGKSTLLQMICGTLSPTSGEVQTFGRVAALLELGSGFNPEFTGIENIYMNAAVLGMSEEETTAKLDDIVAFADIGDHLSQPTKTYSSGMAVRLAFAVQALSDPDILVVDEALAVGDIKFQAKCFERLRQLKSKGTSILLVTHSSEQIVTHCDSAILLENGQIREIGSPKHVVNVYHDVIFGKQASESAPEDQASQKHCLLHPERPSLTDDIFLSHPGFNPHEYRWGDGKAKILDYTLSVEGRLYPEIIDTGSTVTVRFSIAFIEQVLRPIFGFTIKTHEGVAVYGSNTEKQQLNSFSTAGQPGQVVVIEASFACNLAPGHYFISVGIASVQNDEIVPHDRRYDSIHFQVSPDNTFFGLSNLNLNLALLDKNS